MEVHEAAAIFPIEEETINDLAEDIRKHGQKVPIELLDGKILDGRRRQLACEKAGVTPITITVQVEDPVAYVLSLNLHRRHLSESQRAIVGAKAMEYYKAEAKERQKEALIKGNKTRHDKDSPIVANWPQSANGSEAPNVRNPIARDYAGAAVGVGGRTIDRATRVLNKAEPEVIKAVEEGRMSVVWADDVSRLPAEEQKEIAEKASGRRKAVAKPVDEPSEKEEAEDDAPTSLGVGIRKAHESIAVLKSIPVNDALRKRGFQIVADWISRNRRD